jgi:transcription termination factor Rho
MRKKLETLPLTVLKDIAKDNGLKNISTMKKAELIEAILVATSTEEKVENEEEVKSRTEAPQQDSAKDDPLRQDYDPSLVDNGSEANGILEVMPDGYGFIRCANYLPGDNDVYVAPAQIKRFGLKTGDIIVGAKRIRNQGEKFSALLYIKTVNGYTLADVVKRTPFEKLTPIFPDERLHLELPDSSKAMRIVDLVSPIGKGQRGMIVSQPKAGKTTLLKQIAKSITTNNKEMHLIILLIDERPEEVTDIKESIEGDNVEVIYSTFDELPEHHKRVSEMVIERARRLVEHKKDVCILLDSITRLTRAYNIVVAPSGRTLSGGLDPSSLHMPKKFFGAARNMREGGSLTILATALVDTGSKMDDVVYEEFKGTGNMELVLDRKLSEKRIFPAIDIVKSGTRREDLLLDKDEQEAVDIMRKAINGMRSDEAVERILDMFSKTKNNAEFCQMIRKMRIF